MCGKITKALRNSAFNNHEATHLWEMHNVKKTLHHYIKWIDDRK